MHLISSYCKLQAIDNASLSLNFTSVLCFLPCCWVGEVEPQVAWRIWRVLLLQGKSPLENEFIWNQPITLGVGFYAQESGGVPARAFVLMKYPWSLPCWRVSPSLPPSCVQPLGAEQWETGSEERSLGWLSEGFLKRKKMPANFLVVSIKEVLGFFPWILLKRFASPVRTTQHSSDEIRPISGIMRKVISPQRGWWGFHQISQPFPVTYTTMHSSQAQSPASSPSPVKLPSGYY